MGALPTSGSSQQQLSIPSPDRRWHTSSSMVVVAKVAAVAAAVAVVARAEPSVVLRAFCRRRRPCCSALRQGGELQDRDHPQQGGGQGGRQAGAVCDGEPAGRHAHVLRRHRGAVRLWGAREYRGHWRRQEQKGAGSAAITALPLALLASAAGAFSLESNLARNLGECLEAPDNNSSPAPPAPSHRCPPAPPTRPPAPLLAAAAAKHHPPPPSPSSSE